jgi:L-threonylcarbamoyladenylate synthase
VHTREELIALPYEEGEGRLFFDAASRDAWLEAQTRAHTPWKLPDRRILTLSETGDLTEAAAGLFSLLHDLDSLGLSRIRAELVPNRGLGPAINDRLYRASEENRV